MMRTEPKGYLFSAVEAAIKKPGRKDLALIYSEVEATVSGLFTTNKIKAAPVRLDMQRLKSGKGRAIVVNSGNANACTGKQGTKDALEISKLVSEGLKIDLSHVYVCSTGVIGTPMPMDRIRLKMSDLLRGIGSFKLEDIASAIMTTDSFPKLMSRSIKIGDRMVTISAVCKGAGMICPNMATMLCFILTDVSIEKKALDTALRDAVNLSFNRITVDGDMSTNDTVLMFANGLAGNKTIRYSRDKNSDYFKFFKVLSDITYELSRMIVKDGEGATKLIEIEVRNADSYKDAEKAAFSVANSLLFKTAMYGNDANWGRIMAALGYSGINLKEEKIDIFLNGLKVVMGGLSTGKDKDANERLKGKEIKVLIDLHLGKGNAKVLTCDLTEDYVKINAQYRT
jgi:glutamate N-acetyltransferase/amino-acid N-acetyltransferase